MSFGKGIENRITYDPDEITRLLENQLDKLKVFRFDSRYRSLLGESFINLAARWEKDILSRRNDPFTLVVCGEFKRGKSSLINALLGEDVTPVNVTPETVTLNRIIYGPHSNEAVLPGGKKLQLSDEEMQGLAWTTFVSSLREQDCPELVQYLKERRLYTNAPVAAEEEV